MVRRRSLLTSLALGLTAAALPIQGAFAVTSPALFVAAHPDDEILAMGVTLAEHFAAGQDIHVLWLTDGEGSAVLSELNGTSVNPDAWWGVAHNPAMEGYQTLTAADMAAARISESVNAVRVLASGYTGTITFHQAHLPDGGVTPEAAEAAILAVADLIAQGAPVRIKTHTHIVDNHSDHLAAGTAARSLASVDPTRFSDLRHYIEQPYWTDSRLSQVAEAWDTPSNSGISTRVRNACRCFGAWSPPNTLAIGYHSVASQLDQIAATPKCLFHP